MTTAVTTPGHDPYVALRFCVTASCCFRVTEERPSNFKPIASMNGLFRADTLSKDRKSVTRIHDNALNL